jgi:hypothetical protein
MVENPGDTVVLLYFLQNGYIFPFLALLYKITWNYVDVLKMIYTHISGCICLYIGVEIKKLKLKW